MGFDVNFNNNKPVITATQSMQDGGAGNLGYFEQDKEKKQKEHDESVFAESKQQEEDSFVKDGGSQEQDEAEFSIANFIAKIILAVKDFFKKF